MFERIAHLGIDNQIPIETEKIFNDYFNMVRFHFAVRILLSKKSPMEWPTIVTIGRDYFNFK